MPDIQPNFIAVGLAVVLNFFLGYVWYTPLFGKAWARALGFGPEYAAQGADLAKGLIANVVGCFLLALVLGNNIAVWTPSTWGVAGADGSAVVQALQAACFTWLGFYLPPLLNGVAWEKRGWALFGINGGYYFVSLVVAAMLITHLR